MSETFKNATGRRVVAGDTAEELGEVKAFVIDPTATRIESIQVAGKGSHAEVVHWSSLSAFGDDALVTTSADAPQEVSSERETEAARGHIALPGARILNDEGVEEGEVDDVVFDPESGELVAVVTKNGQIEASRFRSLGSYALVVKAE